jgi:hypothetical protein
MGSKQIRSLVPEYIDERSISFKRQEDGTYRKVTAHQTRDIRTNKVVLGTDISDERYMLVSEGDYDHEMVLQDCSGNDMTLRFRAIDEESTTDLP